MNSSLNNIFLFWSFCFGAVIASFLNVVIWRVPRGESIVRPPSHCPKCSAPIRWYQNIPILSYLALRGRCASCKTRISPRYILVEALGGILFAAAWARLGGPWGTVLWPWFALMIVGSMIDFDHHLLPDFVTVGGIVYGLLLNAVFALLAHSFAPLFLGVSGLALGFGAMYLARVAGGKLFGQEAMGMGDVILMGAVGAISGPVAVLFVLIVGCLAGICGGVAAMALGGKLKRRFEIPFGPYICLAHLVFLFAGEPIIVWYLGALSRLTGALG